MISQYKYDAVTGSLKSHINILIHEHNLQVDIKNHYKRKFFIARYFAVSGWLMCAISIFLFLPLS